MKVSAMGRAVSHGAFGRSSVTEDHIQRTSGNSFLASPVHLKSMLRKATETEDTGLFSINSDRSPDAGPSPTGMERPGFTDDWKLFPSHHNSMSGTRSPSNSNSTIPGYSLFGRPTQRRSYSMTTCSTRPPPSHRPVGTLFSGQYHIDKGKSDSHPGHHILEGCEETELHTTSPWSSILLSERRSSSPEGHGLPNGGTAGALEIIESHNRKLRLKISRNALAKARQQAGAKSRTSFGDHSNHTVIATPSAVPSATTKASPNERRRGRTGGGGHLAKPSATPELPPSSHSQPAAIPSEIEALFSATGSRINGKALLRLKRRFPDLGARLAEMQLQTAEPLAGVVVDIERARQTAFSGEGARQKQNHRLRSSRFRGRISRWVRNAKRAITRAK